MKGKIFGFLAKVAFVVAALCFCWGLFAVIVSAFQPHPAPVTGDIVVGEHGVGLAVVQILPWLFPVVVALLGWYFLWLSRRFTPQA